ncbi:hypothetical protein AVU12_gp065 [Pseudomonas phage KPP21]|uniref:Uncharacterized protein n=1 Tax=Pseudomonas phage KPP21 TaxID=1678082 RepID=A0A0H5BI82_BPK21|nr:hypothetical protein AVU12_gp065 [Pseudomonas phage KPP21]BAR94624.1 hypothetical protein [Pseudomonas phage KPP21]
MVTPEHHTALRQIISGETRLDSLKPYQHASCYYLVLVRRNLPAPDDPGILAEWLEYYHQQKILGIL